MEAKEAVTIIAPEAPSTFLMAPRTENLAPVIGTPPVVSSSASAGIMISSEKKKRGRPRKYGPEGPNVKALSPMPISSSAPPLTGNFFIEKANKGRPITSEKKHRNKVGSENLGEWVSCSTGGNFLPHMITVNAGEDISMKIISFAQQGPRAICILSAMGLVSNVTLRQPHSSGGTLTYEGRFEILSLTGSFTPTEYGGSTTSRVGGLSISLASPDGRVVGGCVAGLMIAASPVQVVVGSFLSSNFHEPKPKKPKPETKLIAGTTGSAVTPHLSNVDHRSNDVQGMNISASDNINSVTSSSFHMNNWVSMSTVENSKMSTADINLSLKGESSGLH